MREVAVQETGIRTLMDTRQIDIRKLTLKRGACYGDCPVYEVTLFADGTVTWVGEFFVDQLRAMLTVSESGPRLALLDENGKPLWYEP